jgi:hypothetical protein
MVSPLSCPTVPISRRPPGSSRSRSVEVVGAWPSRSSAAARMSSAIGQTSSRIAVASGSGGRVPRTRSTRSHSSRVRPSRRAVRRRSPICHFGSPVRSMGMPSWGPSASVDNHTPSRSARKVLTGCSKNRTSCESSITSRSSARGGRGALRKADASESPFACASAPLSATSSKLQGPATPRSSSRKLRGSKACRGWGTTMLARARVASGSAGRTVASMTSRSSPIGTAGGSGSFVRSSRAE